MTKEIRFEQHEFYDWSKEDFAEFKRLVTELSEELKPYQNDHSFRDSSGNILTEDSKFNKTNGHTVTFVCDGDKKVGYFAWEEMGNRPSVWISHAFLEKEYRGQGIYKRFLNEVLPEAYEKGNGEPLQRLYCGIFPLHKESAEIHERAGFKVDYVCFVKLRQAS